MFKLSPEAEARYAETRAYEEEQKARFANMTDDNLLSSARYYAAQMQPMAWPPGTPVYDATFWHIIVPELMRRLEDRT